MDSGQCSNSSYSDPWREVDLIPAKRQSKLTHKKRKIPRLGHQNMFHQSQCVQVGEEINQEAEHEMQEPEPEHVEVNDEEQVSNMKEDDVHDICIDDEENVEKEDFVDLTTNFRGNDGDMLIDLTEGGTQNECMQPLEKNDIIIDLDKNPGFEDQEADMEVINLLLEEEEIPEQMYWENLLGSLEACTDDFELENKALEIKEILKPLRPRNKNVQYNPNRDSIDNIATESIPEHGPQNVYAIKIKPDGNCLCHALSFLLCR